MLRRLEFYDRSMLPVRPGDVVDTIAVAERVRRWLRRRREFDHSAISGRCIRGDLVFTGGYYVVVAIAPTRRGRPYPPKRLAVSAVHDFVDSTFPSIFGSVPAHSSPERVRFEARGPDSAPDAVLECASSGLVELLWRVEAAGTPDSPELVATEVLGPIARMAAGAKSPTYEQLAQRCDRVDIHVNLSAYHATLQGSVPWDRVAFPCNAPRRATDARAFSPVLGFAPGALHAWKRRAPVRELIEVVASDLLAQNGYFGDLDVTARCLADEVTGDEQRSTDVGSSARTGKADHEVTS
jgi:hypothetical protein